MSFNHRSSQAKENVSFYPYQAPSASQAANALECAVQSRLFVSEIKCRRPLPPIGYEMQQRRAARAALDNIPPLRLPSPAGPPPLPLWQEVYARQPGETRPSKWFVEAGTSVPVVVKKSRFASFFRELAIKKELALAKEEEMMKMADDAEDEIEADDDGDDESAVASRRSAVPIYQAITIEKRRA